VPTQNLTTLATLIGDDSHACSFQSLGQYRSALLKAIAQNSALPASVAVPDILSDAVQVLLEVPQLQGEQAYSARPIIDRVRAMLATAPHPVSGEQVDGDSHAPAAQDVFELRLCEQKHTVLKPGVVYLFTVDPNCAACVELDSAHRAQQTDHSVAVN